MKWLVLYQFKSGDFGGVTGWRTGRGKDRRLHDFGRIIGAGGIGVGFIVGGHGGRGGLGFGLEVGNVEGQGILNMFGPATSEGFDVFLFGKTLGLNQEVAEVGEGGDGLGLEEALGAGGEEQGNGGVEVGGGEDFGVEDLSDLAAGLLGGEVIAVPFGMEIAEAHVVDIWGHLAAAAIGEEKHTRAGTVLFIGHRSSPEN